MTSRGGLVHASVVVAALIAAHPAQGWEYFEHRYLGDVACRLLVGKGLFASTDCTVTPEMPLERQLTFGDLVALAGDHYADAKALAEAVQAYRSPSSDPGLRATLQAREFQLGEVRSWMGTRYRQSDVAACIEHALWLQDALDDCAVSPGTGDCAPTAKVPSCRDALKSIPVPALPGHGCAWPDRQGDCREPSDYESFLFMNLPGYIDLARSNRAHFGTGAERAADESLKAAAAEPAGSLKRLTHLAFAAHYFTDRHSSGHMRTPITGISSKKASRVHDFDCQYGLAVC